MACGLLNGATFAIRQESEIPFVHGKIELSSTSLQAVKLDPNCLKQVHPNRPGSGPGGKNTEPGWILAVLGVPSIIRPLRSADAKFGKIV